jgi:DNA-binding CsgD family transcriptional regulator
LAKEKRSVRVGVDKLLSNQNGRALNGRAGAVDHNATNHVLAADRWPSIITAPTRPFWFGPEIVKRITRGHSFCLSKDEVRKANSSSGLSLMIWHGSPHPRDFTNAQVGAAMLTCFDRSYRGFQLREVLVQADCLEQYEGMRNAGACYFDPFKGYCGYFPQVDATRFSEEARNAGMTRELARTQVGSWLGSMFLSYAPPKFGLSASQQRLVLSALAGGTGQELAERLGISLFAVKKSWRDIQDKVVASDPNLVRDDAHGNGRTAGREKKQHLLAYFREHLEELRPYSQKINR